MWTVIQRVVAGQVVYEPVQKVEDDYISAGLYTSLEEAERIKELLNDDLYCTD